MMMGREFSIKPYINHKKIPVTNTAYIFNDIPSVFRVLVMCTICGTNERVVQQAAAIPTSSVGFDNIELLSI